MTDKIERNSELAYEDIPDRDLIILLDWLCSSFDEFTQVYGYPSDLRCHIIYESLVEVVRRVDKRKAYYYCFHSMPINERKEISLYAYWILKFHPFTVVDKRFADDQKATLINESFAIFLIASELCRESDESNIEFKPGSYTEKLQYSFRYRSFTIDSMMLLVEAMTLELFKTKFEGHL